MTLKNFQILRDDVFYIYDTMFVGGVFSKRLGSSTQLWDYDHYTDDAVMFGVTATNIFLVVYLDSVKIMQILYLSRQHGQNLKPEPIWPTGDDLNWGIQMKFTKSGILSSIILFYSPGNL